MTDSACATLRPVLWLEPRAVHVWRACQSPYRCEPLAYLSIPTTPVARSLLERTGWLHLTEDLETLLLGQTALALAQTIPGADQPRFPLEQGDLRGAPDAAWNTCTTILDGLLGVDAGDEGDLLCLVPSDCGKGSTLWLRALPEALLGDRYPTLRVESVVTPLFQAEPRPGLEWAWVIGDRGVSVGARHAGEVQETHVHRGCRSVLDKTAATTGLRPCQVRDERDREPIRKTQEIFLRDLLKEVLAQSIPLFQEAWSGPLKPSISLRVAGPAPITAGIEAALERALHEYSLGPDLEAHVVPYADLLTRAATSPVEQPPASPPPQTRPQAIRPRA